MMPIQQNQKDMLPKEAKMQPSSVYTLRSMVLIAMVIAQDMGVYLSVE